MLRNEVFDRAEHSPLELEHGRVLLKVFRELPEQAQEDIMTVLASSIHGPGGLLLPSEQRLDIKQVRFIFAREGREQWEYT